MSKTRVFFTIFVLLVLLVSVSAALAQRGDGDRDGDGLPDDVDQCPDQAGPRDNGGCPVDPDSDGDGLPDSVDQCPGEAGPRENGGCPVVEAPAPAPGPGDADGDGVTDDVDSCPQQGGPAANNGCPLPAEVEEDQPEIELPPLPALPVIGPCVMATNGHVAVNLRSLPFTTAPVVGSMDPQQTYPVYYFFDNPQDERWYQTSPGLAASWVTRLGGICRGLPVLSFAEDAFAPENIGLQLASPNLLSLDDLSFNPQPEPPADPFDAYMPEDFPFPDPEAMEHVLLARFGPDHPPDPILVGLLLPAVQKVREAAAPTDNQNVMFVVPGDLAGFNPQPEPPPEASEASPNPVGADEMFFEVSFELLPPVAEDDGTGEDEPQLIPVAVSAMNLGDLSLVACEGEDEIRLRPADGEACLYTNDMGQVAACFTSEMETYCIYGYTPDPEDAAGP